MVELVSCLVAFSNRPRHREQESGSDIVYDAVSPFDRFLLRVRITVIARFTHAKGFSDSTGEWETNVDRLTIN